MAGPFHQTLALRDRDDARRYETAAPLELHDDIHHVHMLEILASIPALDGTGVLRNVARSAFAEALGQVLYGVGDREARSHLVEGYYAWLGLGMIWLDTLDAGTIEAPTSHIAEGWSRLRGEPRRTCSVTEGFLEAAAHAITGRHADVRESICASEQGSRCRFTVSWQEHGDRCDDGDDSGGHLRLLPTPSRTDFEGGIDGLIEVDGRRLAHVPAGLYPRALAEWLAIAGRRGAPVLAHALAQLDYVSAPATAPLRVVPND